MKNPAFDTLYVRTATAAVIAAVFIIMVSYSALTLAMLFMIICVGGIWEFYKMSSLSAITPQRYVGMLAGSAMVAASSLYAFGYSGAGMTGGAVLVLIFVIFGAELYRKSPTPLANIAATLAGIIYVALPLSLLIMISTAGVADIGTGPLRNGIYHPWIILCYMFIIWGNDVGAYIFGVSFGRHKLFERISPKKSWEGFFGGLLVAVGVGLLSGRLLGGDTTLSMLFWSGLALIAATSGVFGDLVESMLKRSAGIKDSGRIMPGHGGFLDRFDAVLYSAPFVYLYFTIFVHLYPA